LELLEQKTSLAIVRDSLLTRGQRGYATSPRNTPPPALFPPLPVVVPPPPFPPFFRPPHCVEMAAKGGGNRY